MSRKSLDILSTTYQSYQTLGYKQLATYLIQHFDWGSDNSVALFRRRLKQGIDNHGTIGSGFIFPDSLLKSAFGVLDENMRKYK